MHAIHRAAWCGRIWRAWVRVGRPSGAQQQQQCLLTAIPATMHAQALASTNSRMPNPAFGPEHTMACTLPPQSQYCNAQVFHACKNSRSEAVWTRQDTCSRCMYACFETCGHRFMQWTRCRARSLLSCYTSGCALQAYCRRLLRPDIEGTHNLQTHIALQKDMSPNVAVTHKAAGCYSRLHPPSGLYHVYARRQLRHTCDSATRDHKAAHAVLTHAHQPCRLSAQEPAQRTDPSSQHSGHKPALIKGGTAAEE